jgi:hypothetical protein
VLPPIDCLWGWSFFVAAERECRPSLLVKTIFSCNTVYIIKTLVFCVHILVVCMTT